MSKKCFFIGIVVVLLICLSFVFLPRALYTIKMDKYLKNNSTTINTTDKNFSGLNLLQEDLENNIIFFTGEAHANYKSYELQLYFIKYFHEKAGIKYLLFEAGYSAGKLMDEYITTGDEKLLSFIIKSFNGSMGCNEGKYNLLKEIYNYNKSLPLENKLKIIGCDIDHSLTLSVSYINRIFPDKKASEVIKKAVEDIKMYGTNTGVKNLSKPINNLKSNFSENPKVYEEYLGDNFFHFKMALKNAIEFTKSDREDDIIDNFITIYSTLPKGKYYGQWGMSHVYQNKNTAIEKSIASFLQNEYEETKGRVLSIAYFYKNLSVMNYDGSPLKLQDNFGVKALEKANNEGDMILYKLTSSDNLFDKLPHWIPGGALGTNKYYQYIALIKDSEATKKFTD